jgi:hypothetical protein
LALAQLYAKRATFEAEDDVTEEERQRIANALTARGATLPCGRCGRPSFSVLEDLVKLPLQPATGPMLLGGRHVPAAVVVCTNCGNVSLHALGTLGLMQIVGGQ